MEDKKETNSKALTGMILGIISVVICWLPIIGLALGITSLVLSVKGNKTAKETNNGKGFAIAGISCGSVGIVLNVIYSFVWILYIAIFKYTYDTIKDETNVLREYNYNSVYRNYERNETTILDDYDI